MTEKHCIPTGPKFVDITGQKFSALSVVRYAGKKGEQQRWECICDCGNTCIKFATQLKHRKNQDCGCTYRRAGEHKAKYPVEYRHWRSMRNRCLNKNSDGYDYYGGAGVTICERWDSFPAFMEDIGPMPTEAHQIDRYPNHAGNYEPSNCRWATPKEQCNNRRNNTLLTIDGETRTVQQWCDIVGADSALVYNRLGRGWSPVDALYLPLQSCGRA